MNVSLTPKLEKLVKQRVKSGLYNSASEVVRESLRLLEERDKLKEIRLRELRKEVARGIEQLEHGDFTEVTGDSLSKTFDGIKIGGRKKLSARRKKRIA